MRMNLARVLPETLEALQKDQLLITDYYCFLILIIISSDYILIFVVLGNST